MLLLTHTLTTFLEKPKQTPQTKKYRLYASFNYNPNIPIARTPRIHQLLILLKLLYRSQINYLLLLHFC